MRFLLDMPVSRTLLGVLERLGHQGAHADDLGLARATDQELLDLARHEGSVIVTADLDFPRILVMSRSAGPGLILFRGGSYSDEDMRL